MIRRFSSAIGSDLADRLRNLRGPLFVATLTATVLALGAASAIRIAAPTSRADLSLILVAGIVGAVAALSASQARRLRTLRRALGPVAAVLLATYVVAAASRPPAIVSAAKLVAFAAPAASDREVAMTYVYRETTNDALGAKLPAGKGWTVSPPTETLLQSVGNGLSVRIEATRYLDSDEELGDVADRLLSALAAEAKSVWEDLGGTASIAGRAAVFREIEVRNDRDVSERRVLIAIDDGGGAVVVVWVAGPFESMLALGDGANGPWLGPTLATATVDPQRLASQRSAAAERSIAEASRQTALPPYRPRRGGRAGALQSIADQLDPRRLTPDR